MFSVGLQIPASEVALLKESYQLGREGKVEEAVEILEKLVQQDPTFLIARRLLAVFLMQLKRYDEAEIHIDYLLEENPDDETALLLKAQYYQAVKDYPQAILYFERVLEKKEVFAARVGLAISYLQIKEYEEAKIVASSIEPENENQAIRREKLLTLIEKYQTNYFIQTAYEYVEKRAYECAELILLQRLCIDPNNDAIRLALARIFGLDGLYQKAVNEVCCVLKKDPHKREALSVLAEIYNWSGNPVQSILLYRRLLNESCEDNLAKNLRLGLAYAYLGIQNRSGASQIAEELQNPDLCEAIKWGPFLRLDYPLLDGTQRFLADSQDLHISEKDLHFSWWQGNCAWDLFYQHIDSSSPGFGGYLDRGYLRAYLPLSLFVDGGFGGGVAHLNGHLYFLGNLNSTIRLPWSTILLSWKNEIETITAQSLDNLVRYWELFANYTYDLTFRQYAGVTYSYRKYHGNHVHYAGFYYDYQIRTWVRSNCYKFPFNPEIDLRYDLSYRDAPFDPLLGYFSPQNYWENRLTLAMRTYNKDFEPIFEFFPSISYVNYKRNSVPFKSIFFGGVFNFYVHLMPRMWLVGGIKMGKYPFGGSGVGINVAREYDYREFAARLAYEF